jgi:DNA-binding transcriptional LysR family regulator
LELLDPKQATLMNGAHMDRPAVMQTFIRIVDTGSFSPVTQHLNGAEPAVSIAQLEERLDV